MIAIAIIAIIFVPWFINYAYIQNKSNLKLTSKDISQSLYNARNMAINWFDSSSWNLSIWVYFDNRENNKNKLLFYSYPFDLDIENTDLLNYSDKKFIKEVDFYKWVELKNVEWKDKFLFLFNAISGSWNYYYWDSNNDMKSFSWKTIDIKISFWWTDSKALTKNIVYVVWTNIVDY